MEVALSAGPTRTPQLRAVTLGMSPVPSTIVTNGAVVGAEHWAYNDTLGIAENVRPVEGLRLTVVLTKLTEVPHDNALTVGGLHNCWRFQAVRMLRHWSSSDRAWRVLNLVFGLYLGGALNWGSSEAC